MVATANPLASPLRSKCCGKGGNAIDAAVAAQLVLGWSSRSRQGSAAVPSLMYWDARRKDVHAFDVARRRRWRRRRTFSSAPMVSP